jgi:hypothetical protein
MMRPPPHASTHFTLPFGLEDARGRLHREGVLRLPTQKDIIAVLKVAGEIENPAYLETLLLARMLVRLGDLELTDEIRRDIVEQLVEPDIEHLSRVFEALSRPADQVVCPHCGLPTTRQGESHGG